MPDFLGGTETQEMSLINHDSQSIRPHVGEQRLMLSGVCIAALLS